MKKKHTKLLSLLTAIVMLLTIATPAFATDEATLTEEETTPVVQSININANYYTGENNSYTIVFTLMEEIPAIAELSMKIKFEGSSVSQASFAENVLVDGAADIMRGSDYAVFPLTYAEPKSIPQRTQLCTLVATSEVVPSVQNLSINDFTILKSGDNDVTPLTATITVQAGPIVPVLNQQTQVVYDKLCDLPNPATVSYYQSNGSATNFSILLQRVAEAKELYDGLPSAYRDALDTVMEFNGKPNYTTGSLASMLQAMMDTQGLMEVAKATESITPENALSYQFLVNVFEEKKNISLDNLISNSVARDEISQVLTAMQTASALVNAALDTANNESDGGCKTKVYACSAQLLTIQGLGSHKYHNDYLANLRLQMSNLKIAVESGYTADPIMKKALIDTMDDIEANIKLIESGIEDKPTVKIEGINRGHIFYVTFTRKTTLPESMNTKVSFVVTDKNGTVLDTAEKSFPSDSVSVNFSTSASSSKYNVGEYYTFTSYYHINDGKFLIDTQDIKCYQNQVEQVGGLGNSVNSGGLNAGNSGNSGSVVVTPSAPIGGGTIFPDSNDDEPEYSDQGDTPSSIFRDISNYGWASEAINTLYQAGIINGMEDGVFNPAGQVTREQFCKMVVALFDVPTGSVASSFGDVNAGAWYAPYITAAMQAGYIQGQSNEYFGVGESIMRQDIAVILYRALGDQNSKAVLNFSDKENIAPYAEDAIAELVGLGIINGYEDGSLKPRGTATRAEAAKMIYGIYQYINR